MKHSELSIYHKKIILFTLDLLVYRVYYYVYKKICIICSKNCKLGLRNDVNRNQQNYGKTSKRESSITLFFCLFTNFLEKVWNFKRKAKLYIHQEGKKIRKNGTIVHQTQYIFYDSKPLALAYCVLANGHFVSVDIWVQGFFGTWTFWHRDILASWMFHHVHISTWGLLCTGNFCHGEFQAQVHMQG